MGTPAVLEPALNSMITITAANATDADITNGDSFIWSQTTMFVIHNTDGTNALDVTIESNPDSNNKTKTQTLTIIADSYGVSNFFDPDYPDAGSLNITYNGASGTSTTAKIIPIRLQRPV